MHDWDVARRESRPDKTFHVLGPPADGEYLNELHDWAVAAGGGGKGSGKTPPRWSEREMRLRRAVPDLKRRWDALDERTRRQVYTLEQMVEMGMMA